jgi:hypothetical protein
MDARTDHPKRHPHKRAGAILLRVDYGLQGVLLV